MIRKDDFKNTDKVKLTSLLKYSYEADDLVRNRAFDRIRIVAAEIAKRGETETLREIIRRLLWSMNDESGGVGWYAAEAAAAVMEGAPELIAEYGIILFSHLSTFPFELSVHRAIERLAGLMPEIFAGEAGGIVESLSHSDAGIRVSAAGALAAIDEDKYTSVIKSLVDDDSPLKIYDRGTCDIRETTVGDVVKGLVEK